MKPGTALIITLAGLDRTPERASCMSSLAEPYIILDRAPVVVLGTEPEYRALISGVPC